MVYVGKAGLPRYRAFWSLGKKPRCKQFYPTPSFLRKVILIFKPNIIVVYSIILAMIDCIKFLFFLLFLSFVLLGALAFARLLLVIVSLFSSFENDICRSILCLLCIFYLPFKLFLQFLFYSLCDNYGNVCCQFLLRLTYFFILFKNILKYFNYLLFFG